MNTPPHTLQPVPLDSPHRNRPALLPLGALLLASSLAAQAQQTTPSPAPSPTPQAKPQLELTRVNVLGHADRQASVQAHETGIGKGNQALRDIPQSITVVTEKLIEDRRLDNLKDVLRNTAGVTFQAAEGGEEDIRLRGFSLATTGDIYIDGMRDPAFYDRDTFALDRVEVLRGSAGMLFGRGSTGGVVNQATKLPRLMTQHEVNAAVGSHGYVRSTADFNLQTGESTAVRLNAMVNQAADNGAGSRIDKRGVAASARTGIGERHEFLVTGYWLDNRNGINYGIPWIKPTASDSSAANTLVPGLKPTDNYAMKSDRNRGTATWLTLAHTARLGSDTEIKTQIRPGHFTRDLRASAIRFASPSTGLDTLSPSTALTRGTSLKVQDVNTLHAQSDLSTAFTLAGIKHAILTGVDYALEKKAVQVGVSAAQGGIDLVKPNTTIGQPNDGASVDEASRVLRPGNDFRSQAMGVYAQDTVHLGSAWKLLAGLRHDRMSGTYNNYSLPTNASGPLTTSTYQQAINATSYRAGLLYQPTDRHSFHASWGTSFNTSGDVYSYNALSANTPPEKSENFELGAKLESASKALSTRFALFYSAKLNERNTDPDTAATRLLLSGKRHTAGFEADFAGRITPAWEVYASYMWMPIARVDVAADTVTTVGNRVGDRPGLSPEHSGTVWSNYQFTSQWRVGAGVNFRSAQAPADVTAPAWQAPGFATVDAMIECTVNPQWTVKANLNNLGNRYYADQLYRGHYVPGQGRMAYLGATYKF